MRKSQITLLIAVIGLGAAWLNAQEEGQPGAMPPALHNANTDTEDFPPPRHANGDLPPPPPLMIALDVNGDGKIDAQELANAAVTLKHLDKNDDGELTFEELRPPYPPGFPPPDEEGGGKGFCPEAFYDGPN